MNAIFASTPTPTSTLILAQNAPAFGLSENDTAENLFQVVSSVFSRVDTLAHPEEVITNLQSMGLIWSVLAVVVGLLCLFNGYRFYKTVIVLFALAVGLFGGYNLGQKIGAELIVGGCLGVLLAVICFPLMKYAIAVMGGIAGAFIGANVWSGAARMTLEAGATSSAADNYWIGALVGLIVFGMLAFILFKHSIVMFTSICGATISVLGGVALLMHIVPGSGRDTIADAIQANAIVLPLLVFVPAVIGLILQETQPDRKAAAAK